jgi:hypothetical protein
MERILCALAFTLSACGETRAGAASFWLTDRGADEVLALDGELCVLARFPFRAPALLGGTAWVAGSTAESRRTCRLARLDARAGPVDVRDFEDLVALAADEDGTAYVLERGAGGAEGDTLLWRVDVQRTLLGLFPGARALAAQPGALLVGTTSGLLVALRPDGAVLGHGLASGPVQALARGPRAGEWWALAGPEGACLDLFEPSLAPRWSSVLAVGTRAFAAVPGEERAWIAEPGRARRVGAGGASEVELALPSGTWDAAQATPTGVLFLGRGALLAIEVRHARARIARSQGGFDALAAVAPATETRP